MVGGTRQVRWAESHRRCFSALSRAVVGGTAYTFRRFSFYSAVSVLSVEPWLVELVDVVTASSYIKCFSALSRAVVGGTQCAWRCMNCDTCFSALSRAVVGGTSMKLNKSTRLPCVSVLSVEPWLVEPLLCCGAPGCLNVSVLSVEPWLVEPFGESVSVRGLPCFSALSRAVVGGTFTSIMIRSSVVVFQCSQSSRGWWN